MARYRDNETANAVETTRLRAEREQLDRIGSDLALAREALKVRPRSKRLQERVAKLNSAMNLLQRR
jgi:hypothetical protein